MKKSYCSPTVHVETIEIEDSYCNTSSTIQIGTIEGDYQHEWEELPNDERSIQW